MIRPARGMSRAARLFVVGGVMAAMPVIAHALGLGNLTVDSALNESLKAEIEFTSANKKELKSLNVTLAPRGTFNAAGVQWLPYLSDIKFTVARRLDGRSFIQLTSAQPIRAPFLHFLSPAHRARRRGLERRFGSVPLVGQGADDLGDDLAGPNDFHPIADAYVLLGDELFVVECGVGDGDAAQFDRFQFGVWIEGAGPADVDLDVP